MKACSAGSVIFCLAGCLPPVPRPSVHEPYRAQRCEDCHDVGGTRARGVLESSFPDQAGELSSRGKYGPASAAEEKTPSLLRYRVDKLCFQCHRGLDPALPENKEKWLHGPFQAGVCLACHAPHESVNPKLLNVYPVAKLCAQCHADFHSKKGAAAYPSRPCLGCHSPHYQDKAPSRSP